MKNKYEIGPANLDDVKYVSANLRQGDKDELQAMVLGDVSPSCAVLSSYMVSRHTTYIGYANGTPVIVFGVKPPTLMGEVATPWLVGTDEVQKYSKAFLRHSLGVVELWKKQYPFMRNYVDVRNTFSIRWLQWLKFSVYYPEPYGPRNLPFHMFEMRT